MGCEHVNPRGFRHGLATLFLASRRHRAIVLLFGYAGCKYNRRLLQPRTSE
jgi:hypothetical protein